YVLGRAPRPVGPLRRWLGRARHPTGRGRPGGATASLYGNETPERGCPRLARRHVTRRARYGVPVGVGRACGRGHPGGPRRAGGSRCDGAYRAGVAGHGPRFRSRAGGAAMTLDAVALEVMWHAFASVAEEMGLVLIHSALSPNIRERRHSWEVGGSQAGSRPAGAREIFAEGVIVPPLPLTPAVERVLLANVRTPETRRGDLAAQRAAVERGADGLRALAGRYGWPAVQ